MNAHSPPRALGQGLYPLAEAAWLAQIPPTTARRWTQGYDDHSRDRVVHRKALISTQLPPERGSTDLTFVEMLTLRLVRGFREARLSLQTIRRVADIASRVFDTPTPFVSRRFRTDGQEIFVELQNMLPPTDDPVMPKHERHLINVLTGQHQFAEIVEPSLFANVDWHNDIASRWWPLGASHGVVLDPVHMFGAPRIRDSRVPTSVIAEAVRAEGGDAAAIAAVAEWFHVSPAHVCDAVHFETRWSKRAA